MKKTLFLLLLSTASWAQSLSPLTVAKVMRDPKWMGVSPYNMFWSEDGQKLYFTWNPDKQQGDSLYSITLKDHTPRAVAPAERRQLPGGGPYDRQHRRKVYEKHGDLFLLDLVSGITTQITFTQEREFNPVFATDEKSILFVSGINLFRWEIDHGNFTQVTDFRKGVKKADHKLGDQDKWLKADQLAYFRVLRERSEKRKATEDKLKADKPNQPKKIYL